MPVLNRRFFEPNPYKNSSSEISVIQFGTGVLLRGLIDPLIQEAKEQNLFEGSIAMVKSTSPDISEFTDQDNLYTLIVAGLEENGNKKLETKIIDCIAETWSVKNDWDKIKSCFRSKELKLVISNVTEIGLTYEPASSVDSIPTSYPAKLMLLLHERYLAYKGKNVDELFIFPTELLVQNGKLLHDIVVRHAHEMLLGEDFIQWVDDHCTFCDSLVDRIVPGSIKGTPIEKEIKLPYEDKLAIQTEPYRLWAIQGNERLKKLLNVNGKIKGWTISGSIDSFREQKLRLLNGGHTMSVPIAYALGCDSVEQMMSHHLMKPFIKKVCESEILPTLKNSAPDAESFYHQMQARWANPYIKHALTAILTQTTSKIQARYADTVIRYIDLYQTAPPGLALAFAIYLYLFRPNEQVGNTYVANFRNDEIFSFQDQKAEFLYKQWLTFFENKTSNPVDILEKVLNDEQIFNHPFVKNNLFTEKVKSYFVSIIDQGIENTLKSFLSNQ